jgi:hypothetical protein
MVPPDYRGFFEAVTLIGVLLGIVIASAAWVLPQAWWPYIGCAVVGGVAVTWLRIAAGRFFNE